MIAQPHPLPDDTNILEPQANVHSEISSSVFSDDVWLLDATVQKTTAPLIKIDFTRIPVKSRDCCKHIIWLLLNKDTPINQVQRQHAIRSRISVQSVVTTFNDFIPFFKWLGFRQEQSMNDLTAQALDTYADLVSDSKISYNPKRRRLLAVTRAWLLSPYLPRQHQLVMPPWERSNNIEDIVGVSDWSPENKTEPIHPQTMSPLLLWSLRLVRDLSPDIIEANTLRNQMKTSIVTRQPSNAAEILEAYSAELKATGQKLPAVQIKNKRRGQAKGLAAEYLSATLGLPAHTLKKLTNQHELGDEGTAPLNFKPTGTIDGKVWAESVDYYDVVHLRHMLLTACLVIVCYLGGMRGEEARALKRGCCLQNTSEQGSTHYLISGRTFKAATDRRGNLIPEGKTREVPWTVISPVAEAIRVAELLHEHELLFPQIEFASISRTLAINGTSISNGRAKESIRMLIDWCNSQAERLDRGHEGIPEDPSGAIVLRRFRRTLAWFIYRLPGGRIALGVQYGHLHSYTTDGYGSRVSAGLRDLFPMEEAFSIADGLTRAVEAADNGSRVSGPAASRFKRGVEEYRNIYAGKTMNAKQAAAMMRNPALRIFDNGPQILACCYDPSKALCHPDRSPSKPIEQSPDPTACDSRCANIARTDEHMERIQQMIEGSKTELESGLSPLPLSERLYQRIKALENMVAEHEKSSIEL